MLHLYDSRMPTV